ncbi:vwkA [Symbiodinium natans]|uniref:VwkA protein n=1 Tax=Symbiodinium natans TaxID=878477 RepID=A0A812JA36_9DINO|nr:vwkA [Symbiodinium natans]
MGSCLVTALFADRNALFPGRNALFADRCFATLCPNMARALFSSKNEFPEQLFFCVKVRQGPYPSILVHTGTVDAIWQQIKSWLPNGIRTCTNGRPNPVIMQYVRQWQWRFQTRQKLLEATGRMLREDCVFYCQPCWEAFRCSLCGHKDPKGNDFKGSWNCRACRHKRQVKEKNVPSHDLLQRLIIEESAELVCTTSTCPSSLNKGKSDEAVKLLSQLTTDKDEDPEASDEDTWADADVVGELPALLGKARAGAKQKPDTSRPRHIILVIDASGSMRQQDVEVDAETRRELGSQSACLTRLEAAELCAVKFAREHAKARPQDFFSAIAFHETASTVSKRLVAGDFVQIFGLGDRAANGTFYLQGLQEASSVLSEYPDLPGELVILSDGRPADTKVALTFFQETFLRGRHAGVHAHGIGFGTTVESFAPLQQLACLSGGTFALSGSTMRGLCQAFSSVSSTITSSQSGNWVLADDSEQKVQKHKPQLRVVAFELPEQGIFGKKNVLRLRAARTHFSFDGAEFQQKKFPAGPVMRRQLPYMRGGMRLVYSFQDDCVSKEGSWMVAKSSRYLDATLNSRVAVEAHAKSSALASYFASLFNARLQASAKTAEKPATLLFVPCYLYEVEGSPSEQEPAFFAAERYLPGVFLKYNSNNGYVTDAQLLHNDVVQAFLHFSFEESGGRFIVSDLQGVARQNEVLLTDPQVLSLTRDYGPGDLGTVGYLRCLQSHRCGAACKRLGLHPINATKLRQVGRSQTDVGSNSSWQHVLSESSFPDWDRISERAAAEYVLGEGNPPSTPLSASSWVHVLDS